MEYKVQLTPGGEFHAYRVSTITAVGNVGSQLDLGRLHARLPLSPPPDPCIRGIGSPRFISAKLHGVVRSYADDPPPSSAPKGVDDAAAEALSGLAGLAIGGIGGADPIDGRELATVESFGNQVTLVLSVDGTRVNIKAFKNGSVQLTGVKEVSQGQRAIEHLVEELRRLDAVEYSSGVSVGRTAVSPDALKAANYRVCLINSDLDLGFPVKRDRLYSFMKARYAGTACSYEPCIYHGVKVKFMWNDAGGAQGRCECVDGQCRGNGDGHGEGRCRKVTIAVFQSGKVIATGAQTTVQLEDAIRFLVAEVASPKNRTSFRLDKTLLASQATKATKPTAAVTQRRPEMLEGRNA